MDRLIQMGKDLGYEGEKLQDFVKQQQDYERGERVAERELEKDRIAAEKAKAYKERELERDRIAAEEAKAKKDREIKLARIATEERLEMARIEGIAEQAERDRTELEMIENRNCRAK